MRTANVKNMKYCLHNKPHTKEMRRTIGFLFLIDKQPITIDNITNISVNTKILKPIIYGCIAINKVENIAMQLFLKMENIKLWNDKYVTNAIITENILSVWILKLKIRPQTEYKINGNGVDISL